MIGVLPWSVRTGSGLWTTAATRPDLRDAAPVSAASDVGAPLDLMVARQAGVVSTAQLRQALGSDGLRRAVRSGRWVAVHRGAYCAQDLRERAVTDPRLEHRLQCAARVLLSGSRLVVSHGSAAVLHGLPLLTDHRGAPELTVVRPVGAAPAHLRGRYAASVPASHRQLLHGLAVTTRARTVADLARRLDRPAGVVLVDGALRAGVSRAEVLEVLRSCAGWPGSAAAVRVLQFADGRSESALESLARVWFAAAGLPPPDLQTAFCHPADGQLIARVDFFWPEQRTVCEVDGRGKYGLAADALWREKVREDALRDLGLEVVRGYWGDRADGGAVLVDRILRAFARAALRADAPTYGLLRSG